MEKNNHIIICVGRQLGSGGHDIARMLAMDFNAKYYDRELLNLAAKESGFSEKVFEQNYHSEISRESLFQFQSDAIRKAASEGNCVFVGRCADYILRDMPNVVKIFITASIRFHIDQILAHKNVTPQQAKRIILEEEGKRASYYNFFTGKLTLGKSSHSITYYSECDLTLRCVDNSDGQ